MQLENETLIDELFFSGMNATLSWPDSLNLPDWADRYRKLSRKNAARHGQWQTSMVEAARGPMLAIDEPGVELISLMVATQFMKTSFIENTIGRFIHTDPCPILVVYPNEDAAEAFSKERLAPMIAETPVLRRLVGDPRGRKSENTIEVKHFPGGFVAMVSAGSPMNLAARPVRVVLEDEIDKYAPTKEGDPLILGEERTATYDELGTSLKIRACSPTAEETSRIWASYQLSDQRRPYMKCPHCNHWQYLDFFRHVHWPKNGTRHDTEKALIYCEKPGCNRPWSERQRREAMQNIRWYQTKTFICCGNGQDPRVTRLWDYVPERRVGYAVCSECGEHAVSNVHAGFTASKLYSPYITIPKLAAKWIDAQQDVESRQAFYNTQLALPYKIEASKEVSSKSLLVRSEIWERIPNDICVITVGGDIQSGGDGTIGRIEAEVVGWGIGEESWSLGYHIFTGDPARPEVWNELDELLLQHYEREDGRKMRVLATCIDSGGHNTEDVYKFCLARTSRNIWAIKGASDRLGQWGPVWPASALRRTKRRRRRQPGNNPNHDRYRPVIIGVNSAKEAIRQRLLISEPGPGYCHFPAGRPSGYYDQLTAERLIIERKGGSMVRRWELSSHRANEALDARVYAYAALQGLVNDKGFKLERIARILSKHTGLEDEAEETELIQPASAVAVSDPLPLSVPAMIPPTPPIPRAAQPMLARRSPRPSNFMQRMRY